MNYIWLILAIFMFYQPENYTVLMNYGTMWNVGTFPRNYLFQCLSILICCGFTEDKENCLKNNKPLPHIVKL